MKVTTTFLSIPPYLSTAWENVSTVQAVPKGTEFTLLVSLKDGHRIEAPHLTQKEVEIVFDAHARFIQQVDPSKAVPLTFTFPLNGQNPTSSLGEAMQHNPEQAGLPDLPPLLLEKIVAIAKSIGLEDTNTLPSPVEGCNCIHCQIAKAFGHSSASSEEPVAIEDLTFKDWEVSQLKGDLYHVTNPLDHNEQYNVFLGTPIGCTCGAKDCEHIKAVLQS